MAITQTKQTINTTEFIVTKSDSGYYIKQTESGATYSEAWDVVAKTYTETADKITEDPALLEDRVAAMETRFDAQEGAINDLLISVNPELLGGE